MCYDAAVRALTLWLSVLMTVAAAAVAALVVLPPPTKLASYLAVFFDENTLVLGCGVLMAALLAHLSGHRRWIIAQAVLGLAILAVALGPALPSLRLAVE